MSKPITPAEAKSLKIIPDFIFDAVNNLITEKLDSNMKAVIRENDIVGKIISTTSCCDRSKIYANHWLDFEEHYRKAGWIVVYHSPAYCENYESFFTFTQK